MSNVILTIPVPVLLVIFFVGFMILIVTIEAFLIHKSPHSDTYPIKPNKDILHDKKIYVLWHEGY